MAAKRKAAVAEGEAPEKEKEKPVGYVVQTENAIMPVDATRTVGKDDVTIEAGQKCLVGDYVELPPSVAKAHQEAGVGLSLADGEAA